MARVRRQDLGQVADGARLGREAVVRFPRLHQVRRVPFACNPSIRVPLGNISLLASTRQEKTSLKTSGTPSVLTLNLVQFENDQVLG